MKHLFPFLKNYKLECVLAPLFKLLETCFDLITPLIVAKIIDVGVANADKAHVIKSLVLLLIMAACGFGCAVVAQYFAARAATGTATGMRKKLMKKISELSYAELDAIGVSALVTRMTSDVNRVQDGVNHFLRLFLRSPFIVFGATVMAFTISKQISLAFLVVVALLFLIVFGIMKLSSNKHKIAQKKLDLVTEQVREGVNGVRVIRAFNREEARSNSFNSASDGLYRAQTTAGKIAAWMNPLTYLVVNAGIIAILWLSAGKVNDGLLLSGGVIALVNYLNQILVELIKLANVVITLGKSGSSLARIGEVLDANVSISYPERDEAELNEVGLNEEKESEKGEGSAQNASNAVTFKNVSFRYAMAGAEALTDISFSIKRGETVGVIGGTGCGKSTLVSLIPRFYDPTDGEVLLFGKNAKSLTRSELLSAVAVVDQKPLLFSGTVRDNMRWGNPQASDEQILKALEIAQAKDFILKKPCGLDERVERGGNNFSGGQKQRLSIARSVLANAKILILDDASSALDYATDAALRSALRTLPKNVTVITVSQRVSSIRGADKIIVLDDGKIVGLGSHTELLSSCEEYREIYESQNKEDRL